LSNQKKYNLSNDDSSPITTVNTSHQVHDGSDSRKINLEPITEGPYYAPNTSIIE